MGGFPFHELYKSMHPKLGIHLNQQMKVFRHDFQFDNLGFRFICDVPYNIFQALIYSIN